MATPDGKKPKEEEEEVCEYNMVSSCRYVRHVSVSITWCLPVDTLDVCL